MYLKISLICFVLFAINVFLGANGIGTGLGDIGEMLFLLLTSIMFVIGILQAERSAQQKEQK